MNANTKADLYTRWHAKAVAFGIFLNILLIVPLLFFPAEFLSFVGAPTDKLIWPRFAAILLIIISVFYIPAIIDLKRYRVIAWLAIFPSRCFGFTFFSIAVFVYDQPMAFLLGVLIDGSVAVITLYFLSRVSTAEYEENPYIDASQERAVRKGVYIAGFSFLGLIILGFCAWLILLKPVPQHDSKDPVWIFNHGSIGNEDTQGIPYWIWRVLPKIFPEHLPGNQDGYSALGFYWEAGSELPVGFTKKTLGVIPRVSFNCALCHQGSYRLEGQHKSTLVTAGAGNRVDPQKYQLFLIKAGQDPKFETGRIMTEIKAIYDMPWWEKILYRFLLIPLTKNGLQGQSKTFAWMMDKPEWGIGRIDPFNPVKFNQLQLPVDQTIGNSDMMPLWAMNQVVNRKDKVYALHWDGLNTDLHEVVVAGGIGDGMTAVTYQRIAKRIERVTDFIRLQQPPRSPFKTDLPETDPYHVDAVRVDTGKTLYNKHCADCHDAGGSRYRTVIPVLEVNTDRHRLDMWTMAARDRYMNYESDQGNWNFKHWQHQDGYVAVELTGLWLRGPYLHNGSVPTLKDLLKPVSERPKAYCRESDTVDPVNGGFLTGAEGKPCDGFYFDTAAPGNGNGGHEYGVDLSDEDKAALLSYLKTL